MPSDIDPNSGFRLPLPKREDLDEAGKRAYDRANTPGKTIVGLRGPAGIHLYSSKTVDAHNTINHYLRFDAGFDPKVREVAILTVAREMDSQFEWAAHEPEALKVGVPAGVVEVIKYRRSTEGLSETDAAIIEFGRQLLRDHKVNSAAFARLKALFQPAKLVDLVLLMGNYAGTAVLLAAFDMQVAEGRPILPVP
jgi:4-carboxymuconolactone decarboxylase